MSSSEDGNSQTSKKKKRNRRIWRIFRFTRCNSKNQTKWDEQATAGPSGEGIAGNSSMSGDLASFDALSKGDVVTIASMQSEGIDPGATCLTQVDSKSTGKQDSVNSGEPSQFECPLCLTTQPSENFPHLMMCHHRSCIDCLRQYLMIEITESRINLTCPECQEKIHPVDMQLILKNSPRLIEKWEEFALRRCLSVDPDCRWCPAPDCGFAVIATGCASCPKIHCERTGCNTDFCYHCRQEWHPDQTCDAAHMQRTRQLRLRSNSVTYSQGPSLHDQIKPCPKCGAPIAKMNDGSCNHMTCTVCEAEFCWLCLQEITDLHYLSPSGCTFWGKKPWSRKKKILWQLGLLIGAPLGIALVAGVAVPAIIIGLPIWVARRVMAQFANNPSSKHKRNGAVVSSVVLSIVLSPILAALAVGVGVPVMLLYVYGVVPFSFCRTGNHGLPARNAATRARTAMRIELGSPVVPTAGTTNQTSYDMPGPVNPTGVRQTITNPSIGEASVGGLTMASLSESHASAADRIDGDGVSTTAIAGASITGSITGSMAASVDAANNRLREAEQNSALGPNAAMTSVQVHMQDNISVHSSSSYAPSAGSAIGKPAKIKRKSKGKTSLPGKSSVPRKISEHIEKSPSLSSINVNKSCQFRSTDSSPNANDANARPDGDHRETPVVVVIENLTRVNDLKSSVDLVSDYEKRNVAPDQAAPSNSVVIVMEGSGTTGVSVTDDERTGSKQSAGESATRTAAK